MFNNYIKFVYRNLVKHLSYSLINIFGLSIGIASCILIMGYIGYELSYDSYHKNASNIYRIASIQSIDNRLSELATCPAPVGPTMKKDFPEVVDAVRFMPTVQRMFKFEDKQFFQSKVLYADQSIFNIFSFELVEGDPESALIVPFTMVITENAAKKYFGEDSPLGKIMVWDTRFEYTITGVVKDLPSNLHFDFEVLASFSTLIKYDARIGSSWTSWGFNTYLLLEKNTRKSSFENKIKDFNKQYLEPILDPQGIELQTYLQPLKSIHLHSNLQNELGENSDIKIIYVFSAIGIIILLLACINFINLTTARSTGRMKEVGMRKVIGAGRYKIASQFLSESFIFTIFSSLLGILIVIIALPYFNNIAGREISLEYFNLKWLIPAIIGIIIFVGIIAGSYPAFIISAFKPILTLKGIYRKSKRGLLFRSALILFQFVISITLIIGTLIIYKQQKYFQNKELGFNKENMIVAAVHNDFLRNRLETFKDELLKIPGVNSVCGSSMVPGDIYLFNIGTYPEGYSRDKVFQMDNYLVDADYFNTYEIQIVKGRSFIKNSINDISNSVMINETAANRLDWEAPIGKNIRFSPDDTSSNPLTVIGVYKDIHHKSLYSVIEPTFIQHVKTEGPISNRARRLSISIDPVEVQNTIEIIRQKWSAFFPDHPFYYFFLKETFESYHNSEKKLGTIFRSFSILAIIIACLGLFGLASYTAEQRTKEIGIRKVLGSSSANVIFMLCRQFLRLVLIANIISWPITYMLINKWLRNFAYPVEQSLFIYLITALLSVTLAFLTIIYHSFKASRANPAETLKYE